MVDDGRRDMKRDGGGGTCGVAREGEGQGQGSVFTLVLSSSLESLHLVGPHIHMQDSTYRLYLLKRKKKRQPRVYMVTCNITVPP